MGKDNELTKLIEQRKGFKLAQDCTDNEITNIIRHIISENINDKDKVNLIKQFLLNWISINEISIDIDILKR